MLWQLLTAISVLTDSAAVLLQRVLLHKDKSDPIAYVITFQGLVAIILTCYALLQGFVVPNFGKLWFPILATFVLFGTGHIIYANTLKRVEASVFAILFSTFSIWVMIMSYFLFEERPTIWQLVGALLIFASIAVLAERTGKFKLDRGIVMGLITGVFFGFATTAWVYVGKHADTASWNAIAFAGPCLFVMFTNPRSVPKMKPFFTGNLLLKMCMLCVLYSIASMAQLEAFKHGNVSLVAPLLQTAIIVTILLAVIFLHERTRLKQKIIAAMICFAGVLLIV